MPPTEPHRVPPVRGPYIQGCMSAKPLMAKSNGLNLALVAVLDNNRAPAGERSADNGTSRDSGQEPPCIRPDRCIVPMKSG